jgi:ribosomal protein S18 acetylase RimI-like enzyme
MTATIRPAGLADVDALVALNHHVQSLHAVAYPSLFRANAPGEAVTSAFHKMVVDPAALWLLAETSQPCGYLYAQFHERPETWFRPAHRLCNISHLAVHPDFRRQGVARRLIATLVDGAHRRGFTRIEVDTWTFNREARATFQNLGFRVFNERMELADPRRLVQPTAES